MFDDIGVSNDVDRRRRQVESAGFTMAIALLMVGSWGLLASIAPSRTKVPPEPGDPGILWEPPENIAGPVAPPPPPVGTTSGRENVVREYDELVEATLFPKFVTERVPPKRNDAEPAGKPNGAHDGRENGVVGGTGREPCDGNCAGVGGGGYRALELPVTFRRRVDPDYPHGSVARNLPDQHCLAIVDVKPDGKAASVAVSGCPEAFRSATREAMHRSRWHRFEAPDATVARFTVRITFTRDDP